MTSAATPAAPSPGNWGRWGPADQRGAANLLDGQAVLRAVGSVREGRVLELSHMIDGEDTPRHTVQSAPQHYMGIDGGDFAAGLDLGGHGVAVDSLLIACHGATHLDGLAHSWYDGLLYNGFSSDTVRSYGASRCGIHNVGGIVARGVLLDVAGLRGRTCHPGELVTPDDLRECLARSTSTLAPGDAVLIRTGWSRRWAEDRAAFVASSPGIGNAAARWLADHDVCLVGADTISVELRQDGRYEGDSHAPVVHHTLLRDHGIYLLELLDLEELAGTGRAEFLLLAAPLRIRGGTASPVNPLAVL